MGSDYLRLVGPAYGFFGLGLSLYFASQGAGRLALPLVTGIGRMVVGVGSGWLAFALTGSLAWVFGALGMAMFLYGVALATAIRLGVWFRRS